MYLMLLHFEILKLYVNPKTTQVSAGVPGRLGSPPRFSGCVVCAFWGACSASTGRQRRLINICIMRCMLRSREIASRTRGCWWRASTSQKLRRWGRRPSLISSRPDVPRARRAERESLLGGRRGWPRYDYVLLTQTCIYFWMDVETCWLYGC